MEFAIGRVSNKCDIYNEKKATININTLEELLYLIEQEGEIIIGPDYVDENKYRITIYDDYIE